MSTFPKMAAGLLLAAAPLGLAACGPGEPQPPPAAPLHHIVLLTLEDPSQAGAVEQETREVAARIPWVRHLEIGRPLDVDRPEVEGGYHVAVLMRFEDEAAYRDYLAHPEHRALIARWAPRLSWFRAVDFVATEQGPREGE